MVKPWINGQKVLSCMKCSIESVVSWFVSVKGLLIILLQQLVARVWISVLNHSEILCKAQKEKCNIRSLRYYMHAWWVTSAVQGLTAGASALFSPVTKIIISLMLLGALNSNAPNYIYHPREQLFWFQIWIPSLSATLFQPCTMRFRMVLSNERFSDRWLISDHCSL